MYYGAILANFQVLFFESKKGKSLTPRRLASDLPMKQ